MSVFLAKKYLEYKLKAKSKHAAHSPFVYDFITQILEDKGEYYDFKALRKLRLKHLSNQQIIEVTDFGAGSKKFKSNKRKIADIALHGISKEKYAKLLFRIVNHFQPKTIFELGTSIGLSTLYLHAARKNGQIHTFEGCNNLSNFAYNEFVNFEATNISQHKGNFNQTLPEALNQINTLDFLFVDGNHAEEPTLAYFEMALQKANNASIFIFDDIHWSIGMEKAWKQIIKNPKVTLSFDLFQYGIVFFRQEHKVKEHYILKF